MSACSLCSIGYVNQPDKTHVDVAKENGISESSVRRHRANCLGLTTTAARPGMTLKGATIREADGSWYRYVADESASGASVEDIERAIANYSYTPAEGSRSHTETLNVSDAQIGKAGQRGGGTAETVERMMESFCKAAERYKRSEPEHIILADGGDPIENVFNTPSQAFTNDLDVPAQQRVFRRTVVEGIKILAPLAPRLTFLSVPSNHGAFRTGPKSQGGNTDADLGLDINYQLEDIFAEHASLSHIEFVRPKPMEEVAVIESSGTKLAFHHGHQSGGPKTHGKWWAGLDHGRMTGWDADILVTAHYHSLRVEQSGNARWIIGVSSSDPGSDWFSNKTGESARQGMTAFSVKDGQWSNLEIL